jgi:hypothetical protein
MLSFLNHVAFVISDVATCMSLANGQSIKVTLLGTGCPPPVMNRFGPSILVEAAEQNFFVRCWKRHILHRGVVVPGPWSKAELSDWLCATRTGALFTSPVATRSRRV